MDDAAWLAERGFRLGRGGVLIEVRTGRQVRHRASGAAAWLDGYLRMRGGRELSAAVKLDGLAAGYSEPVLKRAKLQAGVTHEWAGVPGGGGASVWVLPAAHVLPACTAR